MSKCERQSSALPSVLAVLLVLTSCDGVIQGSGEVRDISGQPVSGARVYVENAAATTKADGSFEVFDTTSPFSHDVEIVVRAPGFETYRATVRWKGQVLSDMHVVLVPLSH